MDKKGLKAAAIQFKMMSPFDLGWYPIYRCHGFPAIKAELISLYVNRV